MGLDQWIKYEDDEGHDLEKYYRKVNWLRGWMIENTSLDHDSNCEEVFISRSQLNELLKTCEYVLEHKNDAEEKLPTLGGFFFGTYDYDDWYFTEIENVRDGLKDILSNKNLCEVTYYDWW